MLSLTLKYLLYTFGKKFSGEMNFLQTYCYVEREMEEGYHISSINTTSSISILGYYSNTNNIEMVVIFISSAPLNSTACHFATPEIIV